MKMDVSNLFILISHHLLLDALNMLVNYKYSYSELHLISFTHLY